MTQPTPYTRGYSFTDFSSGSPSSQPPGDKIDAELDGVSATIEGILRNLALIQRDDGAIANASVGISQLSAAALALITAGAYSVRGAWVTGTAYITGDIFSNGGIVYLTMTAHTSSVLATDTAAGKSVIIFDPSNAALANALALSTGAALIGSTGGVTVQAALNAKASVAALAAAGGLASIGASGEITAQAALDLKMSTAALAAAGGAANVGYAAPGAGSVARTVATVFSERAVSLKAAGATGNNDPADATRVAAVFSGASVGTKVIVPMGYYKNTGAGFEIKRQFDLDAMQGATLRSDQVAGQRFNALDVNITFVDGDTAPTTTGETRGLFINGGKYATNNLTTPGANTAGGYGIALCANPDGDYKALKNFAIRDAQLAGAYGGFLFRGGVALGAKELQWGGLYNCTTTGGTFAGTDGEIAVDCLCNTLPYTFDMVEGSFCSGVFRGTIATGAGAVDVSNGSKIKIHDVQMEHNTTVTSTMNLGAQIIMRGNNYPGVGNELIGNNFGAGAYITNTVALFNMKGTFIDRNYFNVSASSDLYLDVNASATLDAYDTIVGYANRYRGTRSRKAYGYYTDVSRLLNVSTTGAAALRTPHRGLWYPVFGMLTSKASNLTDGQMEMMISHSGLMMFQGKLGRSSGGFGAGLAVGTLPLWVMPHASDYFPVRVELPAGAFATGYVYIDVSTGAVTMATDHSTATAIAFHNAAWNAVTDPTYYALPA